MPFPIHRRILPCCFQVLRTFHGLRPLARCSASSCPFRVRFDDAAGFTLCCGLRSCFPCVYAHAFHRASTHGSRHEPPTSYGVAWSLPRLNSHQLVRPSLARRAASKKNSLFQRIPLSVSQLALPLKGFGGCPRPFPRTRNRSRHTKKPHRLLHRGKRCGFA